jgi:hypothetical protein
MHHIAGRREKVGKHKADLCISSNEEGINRSFL